MTVKLLTERHLEFLSLNGSCRDSSESTLVKMPQCWKSHALAQAANKLDIFKIKVWQKWRLYINNCYNIACILCK